MTTGIYKLKFNNDDQLIYIGQSRNIEERYRHHVTHMHNQQSSRKLNSAYSQHGSPSLEILEICDVSELDVFEEYYIDKFNAAVGGLNTLNRAVENPGLCGENAPSAIHTRDVYISIFKHCCEGKLTLREIADLHKVKSGIVEGISGGSKHLWLKEEFPEEYQVLEKLRYKRPRHCKSLNLPMIHKDGSEDTMVNITQFAAKYNLDNSTLSKLVKGTAKSIKGWKINEKSCATSPC
jgi:group I intron endonuclease